MTEPPTRRPALRRLMPRPTPSADHAPYEGPGISRGQWIAMAVAVLLVVVFIVVPVVRSESHHRDAMNATQQAIAGTAEGNFDLADAAFYRNGCTDGGKFDATDITSQTNVTVFAGGGLAGSTELGEASEQIPPNICRWTWNIPGLPVATSYQVDVGAHGPHTFSRAQLHHMDIVLKVPQKPITVTA